MISVKVNVRASGAKSRMDAIKSALSVNNPHIRDGLKVCVLRYSAFTRRRFNQYSRGGGDWAPLAKSTVDARR